MKKTRKPKTLLVIGLMLIISLFFLSSCKSAELKAMENSASVLQLTKGREVERFLRDRGKAMGKPVYPHVLIVYEPINNYTQEEVYAEIMTILENNNWVGSEPISDRDYFKATLQKGQFEILTDVNVDSRNTHVIVIMSIY